MISNPGKLIAFCPNERYLTIVRTRVEFGTNLTKTSRVNKTNAALGHLLSLTEMHKQHRFVLIDLRFEIP